MERQLIKLKFLLFITLKIFTFPFIDRRFLSGEIMSVTKKGSTPWPRLGRGPSGTPGIVCPAWFAWCKTQAATCNSAGLPECLGPCCRQYFFLGEGVAGCPHCFIPRTKWNLPEVWLHVNKHSQWTPLKKNDLFMKETFWKAEYFSLWAKA